MIYDVFNPKLTVSCLPHGGLQLAGLGVEDWSRVVLEGEVLDLGDLFIGLSRRDSPFDEIPKELDVPLVPVAGDVWHVLDGDDLVERLRAAWLPRAVLEVLVVQVAQVAAAELLLVENALVGLALIGQERKKG